MTKTSGRPILTLKSKSPAEAPIARAESPTETTPAAADKPAEKPVAEPKKPVAYELTRDFGFINSYGAHYHKPARAKITNPLEIAVLKARKAPLKEI